MKLLLLSFFTGCSLFSCSQKLSTDLLSIRDNYVKEEKMISMRDGIQLFTTIYTPKDASVRNKYPILMERTPYSCEPYGDSVFPQRLGPNPMLMNEKYIFVYQDVRGRYKSEGEFEEMTPHKNIKNNNNDTDESSDAYDTVDWLIKNAKYNNGKVGLYGISYPGFYASASLPNAHPAIKAVSPQAPVTDEFIGDDVYHNGAFFALDNFRFMNYFGGERIDSGKNYKSVFDMSYNDAYQYFLKIGGLKNMNSKEFFNNKIKIWNEYLIHDTYDDYWKARNIRPHLKNIKPAVLVVGGWFDAEDMFGALRTYEAIKQQSPDNRNHLLMGPWTHGAWSLPVWHSFGTHSFGENINEYYQKIETDFFNYYLKGKGKNTLKEATIFITGDNKWKEFNRWPISNIKKTSLYFSPQGKLATTQAANTSFVDKYISDPNKPVPYIDGSFAQRRNEYLVDDQRFASQRKDVLTYQTDILENDLTIIGKIKANLSVSLQTLHNDDSQLLDADFIVKVIDVFPDNQSVDSINMNGFQRMVRAEVFRGKFRNSFEKPEAFKPGKISEVKLDLNEVAHTFKKGHRIMIQIQSSWFPLVDRNPQRFMKIADADAKDFQPLLISLHHNKSSITLPVIEP